MAKRRLSTKKKSYVSKKSKKTKKPKHHKKTKKLTREIPRKKWFGIF